ncbi:single-stranded DNA-binding protein [Streptomyces fungicidicus]|uniref:single-stranded DNA-binding protein n=1 Tax=Streptomyces fungicidicus TaxID=68203 RepID=UPI003635F29E
MAPSVTHMSGTVTGDVEVRFTESGLAVCRFRLTQTPTQWDAAAQQWHDGTPIPYVCTAWRDLARNATESLTDGVSVLVTGRITELRDNTVHLSVNDLGISLRQRIAYTETSLPSPAATAPLSPTTSAAPPPATQPARMAASGQTAGQTGSPPAWWEQRRATGQHHHAARTPADAVSPNAGP